MLNNREIAVLFNFIIRARKKSLSTFFYFETFRIFTSYLYESRRIEHFRGI